MHLKYYSVIQSELKNYIRDINNLNPINFGKKKKKINESFHDVLKWECMAEHELNWECMVEHELTDVSSWINGEIT